MNKPITHTALADKAVLVKLTRNVWNRRVSDKQLTDAAEASVAATRKVGKFLKELAAESAEVEEVERAYSALYVYMRKNTLPWLDDGVRMLPSRRYFDFAAELTKLREEANAAAAKLEAVFPAVIAADAARLGAAWNIDDYPTSITDKYKSAVQWRPVPAAGDFRVAVDPADALALDNAIADAEQAARAEVLHQLVEPLQHAIEVLGREKPRIHGSMLGNIVEAAERVPLLLLDADPGLEALAERVAALAQQHMATLDDIKGDDAAKAQVASDLKAQVDTLVNVFGG